MLSDFDPEEAATAALLGAQLDRQRAKLAIYRAVLLARGLGLTYARIAEVLDVSEVTARRIAKDGSPSVPMIDDAVTDAFAADSFSDAPNVAKLWDLLLTPAYTK